MSTKCLAGFARPYWQSSTTAASQLLGIHAQTNPWCKSLSQHNSSRERHYWQQQHHEAQHSATSFRTLLSLASFRRCSGPSQDQPPHQQHRSMLATTHFLLCGLSISVMSMSYNSMRNNKQPPQLSSSRGRGLRTDRAHGRSVETSDR